jgi:glycosyltransferase involved in cell wall biosynthesis
VRVCLVAPTCRDSAIPFGGGERYVEELASALSDRVETRLLSFGPREIRERPKPGLERIILRSWTRNPITPFAPGLRAAIRGFDVVHAFQYYTLPTFLALFLAKRQKSRTFVTDLGGGGWTPGYHVDQSRWIDMQLPLSKYAASAIEPRAAGQVILGGADLDIYQMRRTFEHDGGIVFLGRILPHKGIHLLIEALEPSRRLSVIGPAPDRDYLRQLKGLATGRSVEFLHGLSDQQVAHRLQAAMCLVHPTPVDGLGNAGANELLGLALIEAMACGCPVVASAAASLPEIVENGVTGLTVRAGDKSALREGIRSMADAPGRWRAFSVAGRERVESVFTWERTAIRCLAAYQPGAGAEANSAT